MSNERQERIRERAHAIWEREGRPEGRQDEHWRQAIAEIDGEGAGEANGAMNEKAGKSGAGRRKRAGASDALTDAPTAANEALGAKAGGGRKRAGAVAAGVAALGEKMGSVRTAKRAASPEPTDEPATGATRKRRTSKSD